MLNSLYTRNDRKKMDDLVNIFNGELSDLKNEVENMSEEEKEIEKPNETVDIVGKILEFNDQIQRGVRQENTYIRSNA